MYGLRISPAVRGDATLPEPLLENPVWKKPALALFLLILWITVFIFIAAFQQSQLILTESARNEAISSATIAAQLIDGNGIAAPELGNENTPAYATLTDEFSRIRRANPDIRDVYIVRKTGNTFVYIADADSSATGIRPGDPFTRITPAMLSAQYAPGTEPDFTSGTAGPVLSAYAPITGSRGEVVGIAGVDLGSGPLVSRLMTLKILFLLVLIVTFALAISIAVFSTSYQERTFRYIRENEEYLKTIMNSIPAGVLIIDARTHVITDINPKALALIGRKKEDVVGKVCHLFVCPAETGRCPITDLGYEIDNAERVLIDSGGRRVPIIKSVNSIMIGGKKILIESFVDISERKSMEEQNAQLIRELEAANAELRDFAYVVSHDLKAPLRAISSLSQWLYTDYRDRFDPEGKAQLELLVSRVSRMQGLIEGILEYSRAGRDREAKEEVQLDAMVREVIDTLAIPPHISVTVDSPLPVVRYERTRIYQVISNLIGNAVKYMDKPAGEIHVACAREGAFWKLSVRDNGPGIDPRYFEKIFQIFQTLQPRDKFESTGIGLTIVKKIVEMNGGRIWVESEVGKGSIFYVTIPISVPGKEGSV